ncbi:MAG: hypothetical protein KF760_28685 [Candidatus Eremiobacteraeota bacterium]|nr:hypothetical protein [Candidatus Eremiobacteraeota bacterium]MCW5865873.1 hypothetical protein [Candidatus Eremiobacteraeota bacterium]
MSTWESGQTALLEGDLETALPLLQRAVEEAESLPAGGDEKTERLNLLASLLIRLGRQEEADTVFGQSLKERIESNGLDPTVASTLYLLAENYRHDPRRILDASGLLSVASHILERYGLEDELTFQVEYAYAVVLSRLMDTKAALEHLGKAWKLIPQDSPLLFNLLSLAANLGIGSKEYDFAAKVFAKTAELHEPGPEQNASLASLADMQLVQEQFEEALETTRRGLGNNADDKHLLRNHAVAASRLGQSELARETLLRVRQLTAFQNDQAEVTLILGDVEARRERWQQALEFYLEARPMIRRDPVLRARVRLALGRTYLKLGEQELARNNFAAAAGLRKRMKRPPYSLVAEALLNLGRIYMERGEFFRAELRLLDALDMLELDKTPFDVLTPPEQNKVTELMEAVPLVLVEAIEKQERWEHAASILEPLVVHCGQPLENIDRLSRLFELSNNAERAKFWADVAKDLRGEPIDLSAYGPLSGEESSDDGPAADGPSGPGPSGGGPPDSDPPSGPPPRVKLF